MMEEQYVSVLDQDEYKKYIEWKNAEEQGKLLILPCKPGDTVYVCKEIVNFGEIGDKSKVTYRVDKTRFDYWMIPYIGKTVFLTEHKVYETIKNIKRRKQNEKSNGEK